MKRNSISTAECPEDWMFEKLSQTCNLIMGQSPPGSSYNEKGEGFPFLQGKAEFSHKSPKHNKFTTKPLKISPEGSTLMSVRAPVGDVNFSDREYCIGRGLAAIKLKNGDNTFLYYCLLHHKKDFEAEGTGSTFKAINKSKIADFKINLPQVFEQQKIAKVLSIVEESKEKTQNVITALKELKKSTMKHLFKYGAVKFKDIDKVKLKETEIGEMPEGWAVEEIKNLIEKTKQKDMRKENNEFKYIDVSSIDRVSYKIIEFTPHKGKTSPSRARKIVKNNDIIVATVRPTLKRIAFVSEDYDNQICSTAFCVLRANQEKLNPAFLYYSTQRSLFFDALESIQRGVSYPAVTDSDIKKQKIVFPPLACQDEIAEILSSVDSKIEQKENKKKALEELFKTMLDNLMTGKVRVNDLDFESIELAGFDKHEIIDLLNENLPANKQINYSNENNVINVICSITNRIQSKSKEELLKDYNLAKQWLTFAEQDFEGCKAFLDKKNNRKAMIELQQGVEKLVKAYCFAFHTLSEKEIRTIGHKSPMAFVKMVKNEWVEPFVAIMKQHNPQLNTDTKQLELTIHQKEDELANVNDNALKTMLDMLEKIETSLVSKNNEIKENIKKIINQFEGFLTDEQKVKINDRLEMFDIRLVCAFMNLYVLSGVTYPHIKSRYPDEKVTNVTVYDENLAVVKHIDRIFILLDSTRKQLTNFLSLMNMKNKKDVGNAC